MSKWVFQSVYMISTNSYSSCPSSSYVFSQTITNPLSLYFFFIRFSIFFLSMFLNLAASALCSLSTCWSFSTTEKLLFKLKIYSSVKTTSFFLLSALGIFVSFISDFESPYLVLFNLIRLSFSFAVRLSPVFMIKLFFLIISGPYYVKIYRLLLFS